MQSINGSLSFAANQSQQGTIRSINSLNDSINEIYKLFSIQKNETDTMRDALEGHIYSFPAASCAALPPSSRSGYYWLTASNDSAVHVYCDMTSLCNVAGPWMRVAYLNLTDNGQQCPSGLEQLTVSDTVTCGISDMGIGCSNVNYPIDTIHPHTQVCGKVLGRVIGTPDGFEMHQRGGNLTLDDNYVDGVSLTHGEPRQHIWTFAAVNSLTGMRGCDPPPSLQLLHSEYFCDVGPTLDIVWEGSGSSLNNPPWFYRQLQQPITDSIEMRVCRDEDRSNEDIGIEHIEIYVQ